MARVKLTTSLALALGATSVFAAQVAHQHVHAALHQSLDKAWALLGRTMEWDRFTACRGVIEQKELCSGTVMKMFAEQSNDGKLKLTVISPLSQAGIISIDDGHQWLTYHPDENQVYVESSPRLASASVPFRIKIAKKNYDLQVDSGEHHVAGRKVYALVAIPKHKEMPSRRYSIDEAKPFLLRMEIVNKNGSKVLMNAKQMQFCSEVPEEDFELQPRDPARLVTLNSPSRTNLDSDTRRDLGFRPAIPSTLPYGFVVEHPEVSGSKNKKFVAVRITDGLVNATVYQWNCKHDPGRNLGGDCSRDRQAKGIGMRVVGEVPEMVLVKLLDSFIREALKGVGPYLALSEGKETLNLGETLNLEQNSFGEDRNVTEASSDDSPTEYVLAIIEFDE